jgi:hypothetical protein
MAPPILVHGSGNTAHGSRTTAHGPGITAEKCLKCGNNKTRASIRVLTDKKEMKKKKMLKESV